MIGEILRSRYELTALLGEGPIFKVFAAKDRLQGREVSIRLFQPPFDQEKQFSAAVGLAIRKGAAVNHPGVERLEGVDDDHGRAFLVGQLSSELTLKDRIRKLAPFSKSVAVQTAISILEGLDAIHSAGIVHGDISSTTIAISPDGSARLQLCSIWEAYSHSATAGQVVLTEMAPYMAPEIAADGRPSRPSDVYSVGILLYELLCGRLPYSAETPVAMALKHGTTPTPSIRQFVADAPTVLDEITQKAMSKDPADRYRNAGEMLHDLRLLQDAMRFGRSLAWPLPSADGTPAPAPSKVKPTASPQRPKPVGRATAPAEVAPRLNSVREAPQVNRMKRERDVPAWLAYAIFVCIGAIAAGLVLLYFYFNFSKARIITMPNLIGRDKAEARTSLDSLHLKMREVGTNANASLPANVILSSYPKAGDPIPVNGTVNVVVNSGPSQIMVPDLTGLTVDEAQTALKNLQLAVQQPAAQKPSTLPIGSICSQDPPAKQMVTKGTKIRVSVSNGQPPAPPSDATAPNGINGAQGDMGPTADSTKVDKSRPDTAGKTYFYSMRIKVSGTQVGVELRVDIIDSQGTRTILDEAHDAGDSVDVSTISTDSTAKFRIYYDDVLRKTLEASGSPKGPGGDSSASGGSGGLDQVPTGGGQ